MPADEVVQLYVKRIGATVEWPEKELKAFSSLITTGGLRTLRTLLLQGFATLAERLAFTSETLAATWKM